MLYRFKSRATGDILLLGPQGDALLRVLGREPTAQGVLTPAQMPAALAAIEAAIAADEQARAARKPGKAGEDDAEKMTSRGDDTAAPADPLPLRRRLWPVVEMIRRAQAEDEPVVWGV